MSEQDIKLVVAWMVEGDEDVWKLSYESVKDHADSFVLVDGNEKLNIFRDDYWESIAKVEPVRVSFTTIDSPYPHADKGADGKQRNKYLEYIKETYPGAWVLVLDADEMVDDASKIKPFIKQLEDNRLDSCSPTMRHLVWNLACEDATQEQHYVPLRLFKVNPNMFYPEVEHNVLQGAERQLYGSPFTIWHLGYARETMRLRKKYLNHLEKSNIHNEQFLTWWYHSHLFGEYPTKPVPRHELPEWFRKYMKINDDYLYFKDRGMELKHFLDAVHWKEFFKLGSGSRDLLLAGDGMGHRAFAATTLGMDVTAFDISEWAVENTPYKDKIRIYKGDVLDIHSNGGDYKLVVAYDLLEHIEEDKLDQAINNLREWSNEWVLVSIPFDSDPVTGETADPNLYRDVTHRTFKPRSWWIQKFAEHQLAVVPTPEHFNYKNQLLVMRKQ